MSIQSNLRTLLVQERQRLKNRQQSMSNRSFAEVEFNPDGYQIPNQSN